MLQGVQRVLMRHLPQVRAPWEFADLSLAARIFWGALNEYLLITCSEHAAETAKMRHVVLTCRR